MELLGPIFPLYYRYGAPTVRFFKPYEDNYCGSVLVYAADSRVFVVLSASLVQNDVKWLVKSDTVSVGFVRQLLSGLQFAMETKVEDEYIMFALEIRLLQYGGSDDLAIALAIRELAFQATVSLNERVRIFVPAFDVSFTANGFECCNYEQRRRWHGRLSCGGVYASYW